MCLRTLSVHPVHSVNVSGVPNKMFKKWRLCYEIFSNDRDDKTEEMIDLTSKSFKFQKWLVMQNFLHKITILLEPLPIGSNTEYEWRSLRKVTTSKSPKTFLGWIDRFIWKIFYSLLKDNLDFSLKTCDVNKYWKDKNISLN